MLKNNKLILLLAIVGAALIAGIIIIVVMVTGKQTTVDSQVATLNKNFPTTIVSGTNEDNSTFISQNGETTSIPETKNTIIANVNPQYVLKLSSTGDIITVYKSSNLTQVVQTFDFSSKPKTNGESFVNQLQFVNLDTFAFISKENDSTTPISKLYVFKIGEENPIIDTGTNVQVWNSLNVDNKSFISFMTFEDNSSTAQAFSLEDTGRTFKSLGEAAHFGLFWDGSTINLWSQDSQNKVSIVNDKGESSHTELASKIENPVSFIAFYKERVVVGLDTGIYSYEDNKLQSRMSFNKEIVPVNFSTSINLDKGFVSQQYTVNGQIKTLVLSLTNYSSTWLNSPNIIVW